MPTRSKAHMISAHITGILEVPVGHLLPALSITRATRSTLWVLVFVLYLLNATVLIILSILYATATVPGSFMHKLSTYFLDDTPKRFFEDHSVLIAAAYAGLGVLYLYSPAVMIWLSVRQRQLAFQPDLVASHSPRSSSLRLKIVHRVQISLSSINVLGSKFPWFLLAMELGEIVVQTIQGYRCSSQVGSVTLNLMYGILVFINCCSTPIVFYIWETRKHQELLARLVCVVVDGLLDFMWSVVFQGYTLMRSRSQIDNGFANFEEDLEAVIIQVMVVSFVNFAFSLLPFITSLVVLAELREALARAQIVSSAVHPSRVIQVMPRKQSMRSLVRESIRNRSTNTRSSVRTSRSVINSLHIALSVYGIGILCLSMVSVGVFSPALHIDGRCGGIIFRWGRTPTCVFHHINCTDREIVGHREEIAAVFEQIVPSMAHLIAIYECPEFEMPDKLGPFIKLTHFYIAASTIVNWSDDAAIATMAPKLSYMSLVEVSFACAPAGLVDLPNALLQLAFDYVEDVESILSMAIGNWSSIAVFNCNECNLTLLPPVMLEMRNLALADLRDNLIEVLPGDNLGHLNWLMSLDLSGSPIDDLPEGMWMHLPALTDLYMDYTNISSVPRLAPIDGRKSPVVYARETPLCEGAQNDSNTQWPVVECQYPQW